MNPLQLRLAALRRRLRVVVTFRGVCWIAAILLLGAAVGGFLDWRIHLPGLVRAFVLTSTLGSAGYVAYRYLFLPLAARADDLSLALRVESRYPALNDSLASAVQFGAPPRDSELAGSPDLRKEAIKRALSIARRYDFTSVVETRGIRAAGLSFFLAATLTLMAMLFYPQLAQTALLRLADPFGGHQWPRQTQLEINARSRVARGGWFDVQGNVYGVVPSHVLITYRLDGSGPFAQSSEITPGGDTQPARFVARLDPSRVQHDFRFQVQANDAISPWYEVAVLPPPQLVPLAGRPSPQIALDYPPYTDLPAQALPDGTSSIETPAGTRVTLRAAVDRPIVSAWLEYPAEMDVTVGVLAYLSAMGMPQLSGAVQMAYALPPPFPSSTELASGPESGNEVNRGRPAAFSRAHLPARALATRIPARVEAGGRVITIDFLARTTGTFALYFEDESGLGNTRLVDLHTVADPAPIVHLERPSRNRDSLDVLPNADINMAIQAEDLQYALRSVYLEYKLVKGQWPGDPDSKGLAPDSPSPTPMQRVLLYDHATFGVGLPRALLALSAQWDSNLRLLTPELRLRPKHLTINSRWSLAELGLKEGDILTLRACADDFDDVTVNKKPGYSHEVELRVVGRASLELALSEAQAVIEQDLLRLQKQQREALDKVVPAETHWQKNNGRLRPEHIDNLLQAEQLQQQIRARVGTKQEGLRADVGRVLDTLRDNHLPRSGTEDRMEAVAAELGRLAREHLEQIEPLLTEARKESEVKDRASGGRKPPEGDQDKGARSTRPTPRLSEARKHQEEVDKTLSQLLKLLEPWSSTREAKGEANSILHDQRKLQEQTARLSKEIPAGSERENLSESQKADLERAAELQNRLAERTTEMLGKLRRLAKERRSQDPETAQQLEDAAEHGETNSAVANMQEAARSIRDNTLARATAQQQQSSDAVEGVVKALEDRREDELDRLIKRMKAAEQKLSELAERQDLLQKRLREAGRIRDAAEREEELKRLAREQEELRESAQEMVRELSRLRAEQAGRALSQATSRMQQPDAPRDQQGAGEERQEETLERLNEARQELKKARQQTEAELSREKAAKLVDEIKGLRNRQESLTSEGERIHREVLQRKQWTRALLSSLGHLAEAQKGLGEETAQLAKKHFDQAKVFEYLLARSTAAMNQASEKMDERKNHALERIADNSGSEAPSLELSAEQAADAETREYQRTALRRIDQLLDALKMESNLPPQLTREKEGPQPEGERKGNATDQATPPRSPPLAELKVLRSLQQEVNERTKAFAKLHSSTRDLTPAEADRLQAICQEQQEVNDLFEHIMASGEPEGDKR
jgi:hypothetical protein